MPRRYQFFHEGRIFGGFFISEKKRWFHLELISIGIIHSPYKKRGEAPFQGRFSQETVDLEIFPQFSDCLKDVELNRYLIVLYWCDKAQRDRQQTRTPYGPDVRGVFACRSPSRPNPINFCVAELLRRKENHLFVRGVDALDGSALLDVKPYSSAIDSIEDAEIDFWKGRDLKKLLNRERSL